MSFEGLFLAGTLILLALTALGLFAVLRRSAATPATDALGGGRFAEALDRAAAGPGASRDELLAAAVAAKHLLELDRAAALLDRLLADDPSDGEAWLERGLIAAYAGDPETAERHLSRAMSIRSDLAESITLHLAWLALSRGDRQRARRLFDEVEAPLETKLQADIGSAGEPLFAEWYLHAAALWDAFGEPEKAAWARRSAREAAPESRLHQLTSTP